MRLGKLRPVILVLAVIAGVIIAASVTQATGQNARVATSNAAYSGASTVGALFTRTASGQLGKHFCTASVVSSPAGDLVITAAHCVAGLSASKVAFVPDYSRGHQPYGVWQVSKIITDQRWVAATDPDDDFAFLIVHKPGSKVAMQTLTGGEVLGLNGAAGAKVRVSGYPNAGDSLISCQNAALAFSPTQFEFDCGGFTDGTSGSPLLVRSGPLDAVATVIGVIGGYQKGGETDSVSYAARFGSRTAALYQAALAAASR